MKKVYVIFIADTDGNFDWVYTYPKPYYETFEEAQEITKELKIKYKSASIRCKIKQLWKLTENNS